MVFSRLLPAPLRSPIGPTSPNVFNSPVPSLSYTSPTIIEPGVESHEIQKRARLGGIGSYENYDEQESPDQPLLIAEPTKTGYYKNFNHRGSNILQQFFENF